MQQDDAYVAYALHNKQKQMNKQFFAEATDKKQLTCVLNKETGEILNDPDAVLEYVQSSIQE